MYKSQARFKVLSKFNFQAVFDRETGLVWEQAPSTSQMNWHAAIVHCYGKNVGGRLGWRLPLLEELTSLLDTTQVAPALTSGHPFSNVIASVSSTDLYWSATTDTTGSNRAWSVSFVGGAMGNSDKTGNFFFVWCVRGGHGYDGTQ
ncbi:MAG: DUF1566 domain-containing protein [Candidatus Tectomicrobia bacterium]|nr:DUF1566 domain-containing protein [Candidatus Tectomicrobia bacterium]